MKYADSRRHHALCPNATRTRPLASTRSPCGNRCFNVPTRICRCVARSTSASNTSPGAEPSLSRERTPAPRLTSSVTALGFPKNDERLSAVSPVSCVASRLAPALPPRVGCWEGRTRARQCVGMCVCLCCCGEDALNVCILPLSACESERSSFRKALCRISRSATGEFDEVVGARTCGCGRKD